MSEGLAFVCASRTWSCPPNSWARPRTLPSWRPIASCWASCPRPPVSRRPEQRQKSKISY